MPYFPPASGGSIAVTNETSSSSTFYPTFADVTTGNLSTIYTSSTKFSYVPNTGMVTSTDFTATSDARLKENVTTIAGALDKVRQLRGVYYNRKDLDEKRVEIGMIAQEVQPICPEIVWANNDGVLSISYARVVGLLVEAMKEQQAQIDALTATVKKLTG